MSEGMTRIEAARYLGAAESEVVDVEMSPNGQLISTSDGNTFIIVPADRPDFAGKTGLMFVVEPFVDNEYGYQGGFPVFTNPPAEPDAEPAGEPDPGAGDDGPDLDAMSKAQLVAYAADTFGAELSKKDNVATLRAKIDELQAAADAETGGDDQ